MKIEQLQEKFEIDVGAPLPVIVSNEYELYLIFYVSNVDPSWDGRTLHVRSSKDQGIVTVKFHRFAQVKFGMPNDEAIEGHPLYELGLQAYAIQKVIDSEWVKELVAMNSLHLSHQDEAYSNYEHFIFFFHDTCFEIVAEGYTIEEDSLQNMKDEIERVGKLL